MGLLNTFQFLFGVFFSIVGLLIFVSLLLTSVDKAIYSLGPKHGFVLVNGSLPNPVDMLLVYSQVLNNSRRGFQANGYLLERSVQGGSSGRGPGLG